MSASQNWLIFGIDVQDSTMRRLEVKLQNNDLMVFTFEGEKKNPLLTDALFQFTPPKGVELDDLTK